jgi:hypothetical protein
MLAGSRRCDVKELIIHLAGVVAIPALNAFSRNRQGKRLSLEKPG